jgi:hypothetical protein
MDYAALAKQYGGSTAAPAVDYAALAKQFGGMTGVESGIPAGRQDVDQFGIPGKVRPAEPDAPRSLFQRAMGNIETIPALASGAVSGVVTPIAQLGYELTQGQAFTPQGKAAAAQFGQQVQSQFYQPRTPEAQRNVQAIGEAVVPLAGLRIGGPTNALAPATRAIGDVARSEGSLIKGAVNQQLATRAANTQAANVAASYANAPMIEGTQAAQRLGAAVNPAISNPTLGNRVRGAMAGPAIIEEKLAKNNAVVVTDRVREDLGVPANKPLNADAIETALNNASKPYDTIRKIDNLKVSPEIVDSIKALVTPPTIGGKARASAVNALVAETVDALESGRSGVQIIDDIRQLRREAQSVYKARDRGTNPPAAEVAQADAKMGIASALEKVIDDNAPNRQVLSDFQAARTKMAQIYDHERALDYGQQKVDPQSYVKMYEERKGNMTGVGSDIAKAASIHPSVFTLTPAIEGKLPRFSRAGFAGLVGGTIGSLAGPVGAAVGLAAGTGVGAASGRLSAKRMGTPEYQAARAIPPDYRPAQNMLRPAEPKYGPNQMVPYDYSQSVLMPGESTNFVFGRPETQVNVSSPYAPNQLPAPSAASTLSALRAEDVRAAGMSRTLGKQAEAQTAAAEAAARTPTGRGSVLEFDPITGTYKIGGEGVKGATPEVFMSDSGASLKSAADKMALNQPFALSAAEKVAWEKTKVDLATVAPEFKGLSTKELSSKMQDRQWVSDTIAKIQEKAKAFDEISKRASDAQAVRNATMQREKMIDLLSDLEDALRPARPSKTGGQGPKTREFRRNALAPESENKNALPPRLEASGMTTNNPTGRFTQ